MHGIWRIHIAIRTSDLLKQVKIKLNKYHFVDVNKMIYPPVEISLVSEMIAFYITIWCSGYADSDHFLHAGKLIPAVKAAHKNIGDIVLKWYVLY